MALPIINSVASWILKKRIHQIELFLKYPNEVQDELLINLIRQCDETVIGKKYDLEKNSFIILINNISYSFNTFNLN